MPHTLSRVLLADKRIFGRIGASFLICVPADEADARDHLARLGIICAGPYRGVVCHNAVLFGDAPKIWEQSLVWHLNATDMRRVQSAGLIDHEHREVL